MTLLSRTKETAKQRGLSIEQLAKKVGISKSGLYQWDQHEPKPSTITKVAEALNVSTDYLLGRTDDMNISSSDDHITDINTDGVFFFDGREVDEDTMDYIRETLRRLKK